MTTQGVLPSMPALPPPYLSCIPTRNYFGPSTNVAKREIAWHPARCTNRHASRTAALRAMEASPRIPFGAKLLRAHQPLSATC